MTNEQIKKGLETCADAFPCEGCPYDDNFGKCVVRLKEDARELIIEQEQEIKRLNSHNGFLQSVISNNKDMLDEAVKQAKIDVLNELIDGYGRDYISPVGLEKYKVVRVLKEIIEEIQNAEDKS